MTPLRPGLLTAAIAIVIFLLLLLFDIFVLRLRLVTLYPVQLIAYFLIGRIAGGIAREEHYTSAEYGMTEVNYPAAGGVGGLAFCILVWILYGVVSLWLQVAQLGGFIAGFFGWAICFSIDLPVAIGLSAYGGKTAEPD